MEYQKLLQDTLYWIAQETKPFLFQEGAFFSPEKESSFPVKQETLPVQSPSIKKASLEKPLPKEEKEEVQQIPKPTLKENKAFEKDFSLFFSKIRTFYEKQAPYIKLIDTPLEDTCSERIGRAYIYKNQAAPVSILAFSKEKKELSFLYALEKAISLYFFPCKVIENLPGIDWESFLQSPELKLVIAPKTAFINAFPKKEFIKEIPQKAAWFLGNTPLFFLQDLSSYFLDPLTKKSLWEALCQTISLL